MMVVVAVFDFFFDFLCFVVDLNEDFALSADLAGLGVGTEGKGADGAVA